MWERSNIVRTFRWLTSWRGIRRILIILAWTVTVIGLFYGEENWRGRHAWNEYRAASEARGMSLDYSTYVPKDVPDDQNFAATPFLKTFLQREGSILTNDLYYRACYNISETNTVKDRGRRHLMDLAAWRMAVAALQSGPLKRDQQFETDNNNLAARAAAAPVILEGMKPDAAVFAELRDASSRKYSRFPIFYDLENPWMILLPHLSKVKQAVQRLNLEACAELAAGQSDQALADVKLMLALADSVKSEPFLISFLVRVACVQIAIHPVWEGLAGHQWTEAQLQELQARFSSYDFLSDLQLSLKAERAAGVLLVDLAKKMGLSIIADQAEFVQDTSRDEFKILLYLIGRVMPSGWYDQEKLNYNRLFDGLMQGGMDPATKRVSPHKVAINAEEFDGQVHRASWRGLELNAILHHRVIARSLLPSLSRISVKAAMPTVAADQAVLACALERYRLANGQFPETLEALTPQFIAHAPNDVITGQPYKYRRTDDGRFILYSVGWNEKDDGGVPGKTLFDQMQGDWVWSYPAK
jgi:hypothetical protein